MDGTSPIIFVRDSADGLNGKDLFARILTHYLDFGIWKFPYLRSFEAVPTAQLLQGASITPCKEELPHSSKQPGDVETCIKQIESLKTGTDGDTIVIALESDPYRWAAALFATYTERPFVVVTSPAEVIACAKRRLARSFTLFAHPDAIDHQTIADLLEQTYGQQLLWGLVTGRSEADVWLWLIRRFLCELLYTQFEECLVIGHDPKWRPPESKRYIPESELTDDILRDLVETPRAAIVAEFHSKESCGRFGSGILCSLPATLPTHVSDMANFPGCAFGQKCLWGDGARVAVHRIRSAHFVAMSCSSLRLRNRLSNIHCTLGLSIFSGYLRSYIAPYRFIFGHPALLTVAHTLLEMGFSVGAVAWELNAFLRGARLDRPAFLLLGDPEDTISGREAVHHIPSEECTYLKEDYQDVLPTTNFPNADGFQYSYEEVRFNLMRYATSGMFLQPLPQAWDKIACSTRWDHVVESGATSVGQLLKRASTHIVRALGTADATTNLWFSQLYGQHITKHGIATAVTHCPNCGSQAYSYVRKATAASWCRIVRLCGRCGIVEDCEPQQWQWSLDAPETLLSGQPLTVILRGEGKIPKRIVAAAVSLGHAIQFRWMQFPLVNVCTRSNMQRVHWTHTLSVPSDFPALVYYLRAFLLVDGVPHFLSRPLIIQQCRQFSEGLRCEDVQLNA